MKRVSINRWITRCFLIILVLSMIASAVANLYEAYTNAIQWGSQLAKVCYRNVSNLLDHQWSLEALDQSGESGLYDDARNVLRGVCRSYSLDYLYIYSIDPRAHTRYYHVCVSSDDAKDRVVREQLTRVTRRDIELLPLEEALLSGSSEIQQGLTDNQFGFDYTWLAPYRDETGALRAVIGMDYSYDSIIAEIVDAFMADIIPFVLSLSAGLTILLLLVRRRIVQPIRGISDSMIQFAQNSTQKPEPMGVPRLREIGDIAAAYEKMTEDISDYVTSIEALTRSQVENDVQLELARRIQYGMVPERTALNGSGFSLCAMTRPAKAVGGDFYDCFQRDDRSICVFMGDVSGKGVTAAIFMAMIKTILREKLLMGLNPAEALNQTNDEICAQNPENLFATAFAAVLNPGTGELRFANAGHNYPVLLRRNPETLKPDTGIALGMFEDAGLADDAIHLDPGEGILLYTDGVTEAVDPQKAFFGMDRLLDAVRGAPNLPNPAEDAVQGLNRAVSAFCDGSEPFDDMAILALYREERQGTSKNLSLPQTSLRKAL